MLNVTVLMVGKTREGFIQEGLDFYRKRLLPLALLTLRSVREEKEAGGLTPETLKMKEGQRLRTQVPPRAWVAALTPAGREFTTEEFTAWLSKRQELARPLTFLLGGHWGLADALLAAADEQLSLSRLTMTHELARLVLLEQLYRALTLKLGHPYHV
jgi:23S rRNA (pseudouridine1915-N3)-methyltransferase